MKCYLIVYMDNLKVYQCIVVGETKEQAIEKADDRGVKSVIGVTMLDAYYLE